MTGELGPDELQTLRSYNTIAPQYNQHNPENWKDAIFYQALSLMKNNRMLDVGCGTARNSELFISEGKKYFGIDLSEGMLKVARESFPEEIADSRIILARMNMANMGFADNSFGGFSATASLMHIPRPKLYLVLREISRVLKPGGGGLISTPCGTFEGMYGPVEYTDHKTLCVCWEPDSLISALESCGFFVEQFVVYCSMNICVVSKI